MATQADEIAAIKTEILAFKDAVTAKVADLEATIAAAPAPQDPAVQVALDDLKSTVDGLTIPA